MGEQFSPHRIDMFSASPSPDVEKPSKPESDPNEDARSIEFHTAYGRSQYFALTYDGSEQALHRLAIAEEARVKTDRVLDSKTSPSEKRYQQLHRYNDSAATVPEDAELRAWVEKVLTLTSNSAKRKYTKADNTVDFHSWPADAMQHKENGPTPEQQRAEVKGFALAALEHNDIPTVLACVQADTRLIEDPELESLVELRVRTLQQSGTPGDRELAATLLRTFDVSDFESAA